MLDFPWCNVFLSAWSSTSGKGLPAGGLQLAGVYAGSGCRATGLGALRFKGVLSAHSQATKLGETDCLLSVRLACSRAFWPCTHTALGSEETIG